MTKGEWPDGTEGLLDEIFTIRAVPGSKIPRLVSPKKCSRMRWGQEGGADPDVTSRNQDRKRS